MPPWLTLLLLIVIILKTKTVVETAVSRIYSRKPLCYFPKLLEWSQDLESIFLWSVWWNEQWSLEILLTLSMRTVNANIFFEKMSLVLRWRDYHRLSEWAIINILTRGTERLDTEKAIQKQKIYHKIYGNMLPSHLKGFKPVFHRGSRILTLTVVLLQIKISAWVPTNEWTEKCCT